jgi:hypothetical protein
MPKISSIDGLHVARLPGGLVSISAQGDVPTTGWTDIRLSPWFYVKAPDDGIWDFDMLGDAPSGIAGQVVLPVHTSTVLMAPSWFRGARVHAAANELSELAGGELAVAQATPAMHALALDIPTFNQTLASYDDSFQPTGTIHWKNDGPFGTPNPHLEWKKLHHELTLTVSGPDQDKIHSCVNQAFAAGVLAAIVAAVASGGAAAAQAGISAALSALKGCLGEGFTAAVNDNSHWEYWDA